MTIEQRDKRSEERQPFGTGIHAFVFFVASPFTYARYAQGNRTHVRLDNRIILFIRQKQLGGCQSSYLHPEEMAAPWLEIDIDTLVDHFTAETVVFFAIHGICKP